jgi:hypothetical protein
MYVGLYVKYPLYLSDFNETKFLGRFWKNTEIRNFMKICPVGAELGADRPTEGQTDMTKLVVAFRNFENAPKNS